MRRKEDLSTKQKAAIIMMVLGAETSGDVLKHLKEEQVEALTIEVARLDRVTPEQREVVVLRYFSELSHAEIGRVLGKREGAVRAQLLRALRQMRKVMNNAAP